MQPNQPRQSIQNPIQRVRLWYAALIIVAGVFVVRAFYLQVIKHEYYKQAAISSQLKEYQIPAERGIIEAYDGGTTVPIVLNETRYTLFADPKYIEKSEEVAGLIASAIGGDKAGYKQLMDQDTRYAVLAKKLTKEQKEKVDRLDLLGIGTRETPIRVYPQKELAAHVLGFVNDEGEGKYGVEQALNDALKGRPGQLKAITDAKGVPLVASGDNVIEEPEAGERVVLTLDISMQKQLEEILKRGVKRAQSKSGSALIMDPNTGAIKAMANYPTYNPADFSRQKDTAVFANNAAGAPLEVGSIMKPLTVAAALDSGAVTKNQSYFDPGFVKIDDKTITNVEEVGGAATRSVSDILVYSLNTGATWLLMQMGGGKVNDQARQTWHSYMTDRYQLGKLTGIEQGFEAAGTIPDPNDGFGLNIQYANTSFGQGMTATILQMGGAISSVLNGGTYYKPHLVAERHKEGEPSGKESPEVVRQNVVSSDVSKTIKTFMERVVAANNPRAARQGYSVGGKTGTAQIARPEGGYFENKYNGMYMGFVGGDKPEYVVVLRIDEPNIPGYAGAIAAGPVFADISNMLMDNFAVTPRSN